MLRDDIFPFQFIKKSRFTGSYQGMFYRIEKAERIEQADPDTDQEASQEEKKVTVLLVSVFPGPYAYEYTAPEQITSAEFEFSEEGYEQAKDWLEAQSLERDWMHETLPL